jgi:DNA (cytosine-5)-methyltransferase 1
VGEGGISDAVGAEVRVEPERRGGAAREAERRYSIPGKLGFFPPGPDDEPEWMRIIGGYPGLAPAIEPGFRVVADGLPMVLDESRADQLRCAGNSVVVLQALVAFRQLLRWTEES